MTDTDIAQFYNLPSAFPNEWPAQLDDEDGAEGAALQHRGSKSSYDVLGRSRSRRSANLGPLMGNSGRENLVKDDEPDPLGSTGSVLNALKQRGLPVAEDSRLRNRFLLSSTGFFPNLFLSQVHSDTSIRSLVEGLNILSRSIDQKSGSLKVLVEANFERFVRAKATIDSVYTEMRNHGKEQEIAASRRSASHLRSISGSKQGVSAPSTAETEFRKNALLKESDYGVKGIRVALSEASVKAEEVWGPALSGREKEQMLKTVVDNLERNREIYEIGGTLSKSIKQRDYESVFEQYRKARALTQGARRIADIATSENRSLTDEETHSILALGRMWIDVDQQIQGFKRDLWRRLSEAPSTSTRITPSGPIEEYMELIGALLELGVDSNPIWVWLLSRYDYLRAKIEAFCDRGKVEIEILRRRLASGAEPTPHEVASYLRRTPQDSFMGSSPLPDTDQVIELWECVYTYLNRLLLSQGGILGEVVDFWEVAQAFIDGKKQRLLPIGFEGESRKHHTFAPSDVRDLQNGLFEVVNQVREGVLTLFVEPPIEDVSLLTAPASPSSPSPGSPSNLGVTPTESRFKLDPKHIPIPTPKRGEIWEEYAFWPPFSNSLSGVHYLGQFLVVIATAAGEMASLEPVSSNSSIREMLRGLVSVIRERAIRIACSTWEKNAEVCRFLEDWTRDPKQRDLTKMPALFVNFQNFIVTGLQKLLFMSEAKTGTVPVVTQPPTKLLQMVRHEFISSIEKALGGLVENAEHPTTREENDEWSVPESTAANKTDGSSSLLGVDAVDSDNRVSHLHYSSEQSNKSHRMFGFSSRSRISRPSKRTLFRSLSPTLKHHSR